MAGLRIVIVHGGLGPVIPKDVVHAEVEKRQGLRSRSILIHFDPF